MHKLKLAVLAFFFLPFFIQAKSIYHECMQLKNQLASQHRANIIWGSYTTASTISTDKIRIEGFDIPLINSDNMEETALLIGSPALYFHERTERENSKSQLIRFESDLLNEFEQQTILNGNIFELLKKSFDVSSKSIECEEVTANSVTLEHIDRLKK